MRCGRTNISGSLTPLPLYNEKRLGERLHEELNKYWDIPLAEIRTAVRKAKEEAEAVKRRPSSKEKRRFGK